MLELLAGLYAIGFFLTTLVLVGMVARDPFLTDGQRLMFPILGGVAWPWTWFVWLRKGLRD